eukprot:gene8571-9444_t
MRIPFVIQRGLRPGALSAHSFHSGTSLGLSLHDFASTDAWSVAGSSLASPDLASSLFAISIVPYLAMLFFLARPVARTPPLANFGFRFLLAFVGATIPAGIWAKVHYHDILSNIDWLHGSAESLLTVTNLLIIAGFRGAQQQQQQAKRIDDKPATCPVDNLLDSAVVLAVILAAWLGLQAVGWSSPLPEPANALSYPTWTVHVSSILEWLLAMKFVWEYADVSGNPRWKGLSWAMLPSHTSGLCACTFHLFFNSPSLLWLVTLQASLTIFSNILMAWAAYRVATYDEPTEQQGSRGAAGSNSVQNAFFWTNLATKTALIAGAVKFGEVFLPFPFEAAERPQEASAVALSLLLLPSLFVANTYWQRSRQPPKTPELDASL